MTHTTSLASNLQFRIDRSMDAGIASERASRRAFISVSALLFAASTAVTIALCASMSAMGGDADARRLDDVDGVDADAGTDLARRRGVVPRHVDRDDGGDDAAVPRPHAGALPPGRRPDSRHAPRPADRDRGRGLLRRVDRVRNGRVCAGRRAGGRRNATAGAGARRSDRGRRRRPDRRRAAVLGVEGALPRLLPGDARARPRVAGRRRHGLAARPAPRPPLRLLLCGAHGGPPRHGRHGPSRDGGRGGRHLRRTPCARRRAHRASHRGRPRRGRVISDRASLAGLG